MRPMRRRRTRIGLATVAMAAAIAALILGIGGSGGHRHGQRGPAHSGTFAPTDLGAAASYLGLSPARLRARLRQGQTLAAVAQSRRGRSAAGLAKALAEAKASRLRAAEQSGKLSRATASRELASVSARARAELHRQGRIAGLGASLGPAASYLQMSRGELLSAVRAGRSLSEIAGRRRGKSAAGLLEALVSARSARIAAAVAVGALSRGEAAELRATLRRRMLVLVYGGT